MPSPSTAVRIGLAVAAAATVVAVGGLAPQATPPTPAPTTPSAQAPVLTTPLGQDVQVAAAPLASVEQPAESATAQLVQAVAPGGESATFVGGQQPRIRLAASEADTGVAPEAVVQARSVAGVTAAADVEIVQVEVGVAGTGGVQAVQVAAIDPVEFRVLTPEVTAQAAEVWERIVEGDAAFTHDAGRRLELQLGGHVGADSASLRVGAYAANGVPPVADALVSKDTAVALGLDGEQEILVAVEQGADAQAIAARLREATGLAAEVLAEPVARRAFLTGSAAQDRFEPFTYLDHGDGRITIDPTWVQRNIVRSPVPILTGEVVCHRLLVPQLQGALQEVADAGLAGLLDPTQYGGCWVPRHIDFNPDKPLSMHGWGLAVDLNVSTNGLGAVPTMDLRVVEIFERWGFVWGGRWTRPDGMHFELGAVLDGAR